ncbi:hypothetical protein BX666DRAFT_2004495 [Dichotomocladium elegans]|nr:hypothetical protein BX666DRAFT_2004495 [Dichotomocladium elegans]
MDASFLLFLFPPFLCYARESHKGHPWLMQTVSVFFDRNSKPAPLRSSVFSPFSMHTSCTLLGLICKARARSSNDRVGSISFMGRKNENGRYQEEMQPNYP